MLIGGVLFYLLFAWSDLALGGDRGWFILKCARDFGFLVVGCFILLPREYLKQHMFGIASLGYYWWAFRFCFYSTYSKRNALCLSSWHDSFAGFYPGCTQAKHSGRAVGVVLVVRRLFVAFGFDATADRTQRN